ncbi:GTPase domain-containing protein [Roseofilum sp. BLCC_M91]|uniref:GTPase domain-containing protein n=1 Tax=Roseofilum halophilum BLCC-M91 TaxID=3022259 RepID=A0ABT7BMQ9_9CYAN|nr:GTPase domain-containing protein [Roseofilum halophilum]MDJ1180492.1 GTPase domain-containing protein [Roseofilum halophilum BLCC-M91]
MWPLIVPGIILTVVSVLLIKNFEGKKIAVLGASATGKTTFLFYMKYSKLLGPYRATQVAEKIASSTVHIRDIDLTISISKTVDLSGGGTDQVYNEWKNLFDQADIVFYFVHAGKIWERDKDSCDRVIKDCKKIRDWHKEKSFNKKIIIVGTHCDINPELKQINDNNFDQYTRRFEELETIQEARLNLHTAPSYVPIVLGSFVDYDSAEKLLNRMFIEATKNNTR